jgi:hypothetical protein
VSLDSDSTVINSQRIDTHKCKEYDYEKFHISDNLDADRIEKMKQNENFFCIDADGLDLNLYGHAGVQSRSLKLVYEPCSPVISQTR